MLNVPPEMSSAPNGAVLLLRGESFEAMADLEMEKCGDAYGKE
jgi:hypothetical protein